MKLGQQKDVLGSPTCTRMNLRPPHSNRTGGKGERGKGHGGSGQSPNGSLELGRQFNVVQESNHPHMNDICK